MSQTLKEFVQTAGVCPKMMEGKAETDLRCHSNRIEHPSRNSVLGAMRKVAKGAALIPCTRRTLPDGGNVGFCHAGIQELTPVGFPKIQANLPISLANKEFPCVPKLSVELRPDLLADRIATRSDTWPDGCHDIHGLRSILLLHHGNAALDDPRHSPSPTSVKRRHDSLGYIDHEYRDAIGRPYSQQNSGHIGY